MASASKLDNVITLAQHRGFVFAAGDIYGGTRAAWNYGPLGVELKENIRAHWWKTFIRGRGDMVGLDTAIILPTPVWEASGHVQVFTDPLTESLVTHKRYRADHLFEQYAQQQGHPPVNGLDDIPDPDQPDQVGKWAPVRQFSGLMKTFLGVVDDETGLHYMRPETAQGIFTDFSSVLTSSRKKIPFGIGQVGKAFRNEITPGNFIFRTREFEQMEIEYFVEPGTDEEWFDTWIELSWDWFVDLGIRPENIRRVEHSGESLAHYSKRTIDIEYRFGFGSSQWGELMGVANRADYDLKTHIEASGKDLSYFDQKNDRRYVPYVIEPSFGLTRAVLAFLMDAYDRQEVPNAKGEKDMRTVLHFDPRIAPVKVAVLPLSRKEDLVALSNNIADKLRRRRNVDVDDAGAIGRRYRRHDEIGTPFAVTVDFDSLEDRAVTVRDRDTMLQERVSIDRLEGYLSEHLRENE